MRERFIESARRCKTVYTRGGAPQWPSRWVDWPDGRVHCREARQTLRAHRTRGPLAVAGINLAWYIAKESHFNYYINAELRQKGPCLQVLFAVYDVQYILRNTPRRRTVEALVGCLVESKLQPRSSIASIPCQWCTPHPAPCTLSSSSSLLPPWHWPCAPPHHPHRRSVVIDASGSGGEGGGRRCGGSSCCLCDGGSWGDEGGGSYCRRAGGGGGRHRRVGGEYLLKVSFGWRWWSSIRCPFLRSLCG